MPQYEDVSMGMLAAIKNTMRSPEKLDDVLLDMCRYGQPKLSMMDSGRHCWIKMHVASQGATFEIKSEFGHQSPRAAVDECYARIVATIKQIGA
jgi:hypothetical protein